MPSGLFETGKAALEFSRSVSLGLFEEVPKDKLLHQPLPGGNHALWILGHIAVSDEYFLRNLAGQTTPHLEAWQAQFFAGSVCVPDAAAYPPIEEVLACLNEARERLIAWFGSLPEEQLQGPLPGEKSFFAPTYAALMSSIAGHEMLHAGQLSVVRKSLGIAPKFG